MDEKIFSLDEYDKRLLYELDRNSSQPLQKLAKTIRKSKQFTLFRLHRFERAGVITHHTAIVDMGRLGYFTFRFYIRFKQITREEQDRIVEELKMQGDIWTITLCHEKWDLALFLGTKSIADLHAIWDHFMLKYRKHVDTYKFCVYSPIYNFNRTFFMSTDAEKLVRIYGESKVEDVDETDWRIIREYAPNVRRSKIQLAKALRLSPDTVGRRIARLVKKKVICGYKLGLDIGKLGYMSYRVDFDLTTREKNGELLDYCRSHPNIYQVNKTIGGADFEVEMIVRNRDELLGIIEAIKKRFGGIVENATYFTYSTYHLLNYIPD